MVRARRCRRCSTCRRVSSSRRSVQHLAGGSGVRLARANAPPSRPSADGVGSSVGGRRRLAQRRRPPCEGVGGGEEEPASVMEHVPRVQRPGGARPWPRWPPNSRFRAPRSRTPTTVPTSCRPISGSACSPPRSSWATRVPTPSPGRCAPAGRAPSGLMITDRSTTRSATRRRSTSLRALPNRARRSDRGCCWSRSGRTAASRTVPPPCSRRASTASWSTPPPTTTRTFLLCSSGRLPLVVVDQPKDVSGRRRRHRRPGRDASVAEHVLGLGHREIGLLTIVWAGTGRTAVSWPRGRPRAGRDAALRRAGRPDPGRARRDDRHGVDPRS